MSWFSYFLIISCKKEYSSSSEFCFCSNGSFSSFMRTRRLLYKPYIQQRRYLQYTLSLCLRQRENELGTDTFCTDYINIFTVSLYRLFDNCKPKASSFFIFSTGQIGFIKSLPDLIQCISRNSNSIIFDRRVDLIRTC